MDAESEFHGIVSLCFLCVCVVWHIKQESRGFAAVEIRICGVSGPAVLLAADSELLCCTPHGFSGQTMCPPDADGIETRGNQWSSGLRAML